MEIALVLQLAASATMLGVIWVVQLVHYPMFADIDENRWIDRHRLHSQRITFVVGPAMALEGVCAWWLLVDRPVGVPVWLAVAGVASWAATWALTGLVSVPLHTSLASTLDRDAIARLVRTNWARTATWSIRAAIAGSMLVLVLFAGR